MASLKHIETEVKMRICWSTIINDDNDEKRYDLATMKVTGLSVEGGRKLVEELAAKTEQVQLLCLGDLGWDDGDLGDFNSCMMMR